MIFPTSLLPATLLCRYQRFLADVELADGRTMTAHCPNTGALLGCAEPGMPVWLSRSKKPGRKYPFTWELVDSGGTLVGINTGLANRLVEEALGNHLLPDFTGYPKLSREVRYGQANSRIDFLLEGDNGRCYLEVKNVTAAVQDGIALFPDAVSQRGTRHLRELMTVVAQRQRAVLCFCVQRHDVREVRPADAIDPVYGATLREALACGVEVMACAAVEHPRRLLSTAGCPSSVPDRDRSGSCYQDRLQQKCRNRAYREILTACLDNRFRIYIRYRGSSSRASSPPCGRLRSVNSPPWARAIFRAIPSPRPVPPVWRLRDPSRR